jgi:hypothetical protein
MKILVYELYTGTYIANSPRKSFFCLHIIVIVKCFFNLF